MAGEMLLRFYLAVPGFSRGTSSLTRVLLNVHIDRNRMRAVHMGTPIPTQSGTSQAALGFLSFLVLHSRCGY